MSANHTSVVAMILDQALGTVRESDDPPGLVGIDLTPAAWRALGRLRRSKIPLVLVVPAPAGACRLDALRQALPEVDRVVGQEDRLSRTLNSCRKVSRGRGPGLLVAADRRLRASAVECGWRAAPHLLAAACCVAGKTPQFASVFGARSEVELLPDLIPYALEHDGESSVRAWGLLTEEGLAEAALRGLVTRVLPLDVEREDAMWVHIDTIGAGARQSLRLLKILATSRGRALVALGPSDCATRIPLHGRHGHYRLLSPRPELFDRPVDAERQAAVILERWPVPMEMIPIPLDRGLMRPLLNLCVPSASVFQADVDRYSGVAVVGEAGPISSRHVDHEDNVRAVNAIMDDLRSIGYCPYKHSFTTGGRTLHNVVADLPGRGVFVLDHDLRLRVCEVLKRHPLPDPPEPWIEEVEKFIGEEWFAEKGRCGLAPRDLRIELEKALSLEAWWPWWRRCLTPFPGPGSQLVIVGCHLDSTAGGDAGYNPAVDAAPGADDDASGIAATLAVARYMWRFRGKLRHTVRFCFFNAEEIGIVGSDVYAGKLKADGAPIKAVVCCDMVGYNSDAEAIFEVHAGYTDPAVRDASVPIANRIASWANATGELGPAQIYKGTIPTGGTDRDLYDGAIDRSDHASFHDQGFPAVVVSEDFFMNLPSEPLHDANPNYHRGSDTTIDATFGARISCVVARTIKELAQ